MSQMMRGFSPGEKWQLIYFATGLFGVVIGSCVGFFFTGPNRIPQSSEMILAIIFAPTFWFSVGFVLVPILGGTYLIRLFLSSNFSDADSKTVASANDQNTERSTDEWIALAERAQERAEQAMDVGDYTEAIEFYQQAAYCYRSAHKQLSGEDNREATVESGLQQVEAAREQAVEQNERRAEVQEQLAAAEEDLETALREHAQGNTTVARIRYRQARDRYEEILQQVENEMLEEPLTVQIPGEKRPPLETVAGITEQTANKLRNQGFGTPSELSESSIKTLISTDEIDEETAARLLAWARIPTDDIQSFESCRDITERQAHAIVGFQQCQ